MLYTTTGKVTEDFYITGSPVAHCYLLDGPEPVLFEAGFAALGAAFRDGIAAVLQGRRPSILFITHMHFDHCGSAGYLKQAFPGLQVAASQRGAQILERPNAINLIKQLNQEAEVQVRRWHPELAEYPAFESFGVERVLTDGQEVPLAGGLSVRALATPGHTWDLLSYYIPQKRILIASEAVATPELTDGRGLTNFLVDYQAYMDSMDRLSELEVEVLCPSHAAVLTGEDATGFIARSQEYARAFKQRIEQLLNEENGDLEATVARYKAEDWDLKPQPKQPEPAYNINLMVQVRHLAGLREQA